jgi:GntR family transcriptional regulator/MocR family aminotransferase
MKRQKVFFLDRKSPVSLQIQLAANLKRLIQAGELNAAEPLPSTRELAAELKVSRNTVVHAYERLISEGFLDSRVRSGVYVSETAPALRSAARPSSPSRGAAPVEPRILDATPSKGPKPFRPCQPDVHLFPLAVWNRLRGKVLRSTDRDLLHYHAEAALGFKPLREILAVYLRDSRGVVCEWWQIAITSGSQQALHLLANLLLKPGDTVYMENPGYVGAVRAWKSARAAIRYMPVDANGMVFPPLGSEPVSIVYVTPSRQFPTGASLSLARRLALVNGAKSTQPARANDQSQVETLTETPLDTWIIEDDYDSEFRYVAPPLPSMQSLDSGNRVIYVGTFSKLLFPSLRLGYVVLPKSLVEPFHELKCTADEHGSLIDQATLAEFIEGGSFYSHVRRARRHYAERQEVFLTAIAKSSLPFDFRYRDGGMNLTGFLPSHLDDRAFSAALHQAGLDVPALANYSHGETEPGLVFGFTAFTPSQIRRGIDRLLNLNLAREPRRPVTGRQSGPTSSSVSGSLLSPVPQLR